MTERNGTQTQTHTYMMCEYENTTTDTHCQRADVSFLCRFSCLIPEDAQWCQNDVLDKNLMDVF